MLLHVCTVSDIHKMMHLFNVCIWQTLLHQTTLYLSIMYACFFDFASDLNHMLLQISMDNGYLAHLNKVEEAYYIVTILYSQHYIARF